MRNKTCPHSKTRTCTRIPTTHLPPTCRVLHVHHSAIEVDGRIVQSLPMSLTVGWASLDHCVRMGLKVAGSRNSSAPFRYDSMHFFRRGILQAGFVFTNFRHYLGLRLFKIRLLQFKSTVWWGVLERGYFHLSKAIFDVYRVFFHLRATIEAFMAFLLRW